MEVAVHAKDVGLILWYAFDLVSPLASDFDGRFYGFCSRVHGQHHIIAEHFRDLLSKLREYIIVESPAAQGQDLGLFGQSLYEFRVAMALIYGAVCGQEVQVMVFFLNHGLNNGHSCTQRDPWTYWIPNRCSLGTCEDDWQGMVIVCRVLCFCGNCIA
jgi:hypothetical protein